MTTRTCDLATVRQLVKAAKEQHDAPLRVGITGYDPVVRAVLVDRIGQPDVEVVDAEEYTDLSGPDFFIRVDETPGDAMGRELNRRIRAGTARPEDFGTWSPVPAGDEPSEVQAEPDRARPAPDVEFVPLDDFQHRIKLRFMAEYGADFALWDADGTEGIEDLLPMPAGLRAEIGRWVQEWVTHDSGAGRIPRDFATRGRRLAEELQRALGDGYRIDYLGP